ncbi:MAG: DUF2945 domain-containing protein [Sphingomonas sp.]|nr:MAG: DUF2945 domain-containing protein [Sphingomonas sp.]
MKDHKVAASKDNPEFIVETDEGKRAAHKAGAFAERIEHITGRYSATAFFFSFFRFGTIL